MPRVTERPRLPGSSSGLAEGWHEIRLGDACTKIGSGATPRGGSGVYVESGQTALIRSQNVYNDGFRKDGLVFITSDHAEELAQVVVMPGDVLLNITGDSVARSCQVDESILPARVNQHVAIVRPDPAKLDSRFLRYVFISPRMQAMMLSWAASGGTRNALTKEMIESFSITAPCDVSQQRAIAHILGTLDDKIELNRRMNETLEAMARAIFKSWFIDFDPVRRNIARRTGQNQPSPQSPLPGGEGMRASPGHRPPSPSERGTGAEGAQHGRRSYRGGYDFSGLVERARALRKQQTDAEGIFWELVRNRQFLGLQFRRQHQIGDYIADFYCHQRRLVVEFDGGVHSGARVQQKDPKRDAYLRSLGLTVLRFRNEQVFEDPGSVLQDIAAALSPLPLGEGLGEGGIEAFDALFPDSFQDSPLGKIPKGWRVTTLDDFASLNPEAWTKDTAPNCIDYVDLTNVKWGRIEATTACSWGNAPSRAQRVLRLGDTIVGTVRPANGSYTLIADAGLTGSTGFAVLRPRKPAFRDIVYLAVTAPDNIERLGHLADGAAYPAVHPDAVRSTEIVKAPESILDAFSRSVRSLLDRIAANYHESRSLSAIRDALLPKLISGELRLNSTPRKYQSSLAER